MQKMTMVLVVSMRLFLASCVYAAEETMVLETYYPSPYGVYNELRLYPRTSPLPACVAANDIGVMYYDNNAGQDTLMVCTGSGWSSITGFWSQSGSSLYPNNNGWNVGIGTMSPASKLTVVGNRVNVESNTPTEGGEIWLGGPTDFPNDDFIVDNYNGRLRFVRTNPSGAEVATFLQNGNFGIGTTAPTRRLDVTGGAGTSAAIFEDIPVNAGYGGELFMQARNNAGSRISYASVKAYADDGTTGNEGGSLVFKTVNAGLAEKMRINRFGNVGIGTANPSYLLHLSSASPVLEITDSDAALNAKSWLITGNNANTFRFQAIADSGIGGGDLIDIKRSGNQITSMDFLNSGAVKNSISTAGNSYFTSGNVGIGTSSPAFRLDVSSSVGAAGSVPLRLKSTAPETGTLLFQIGAQANTENTIVSLDLWEGASKNFTIAGWNLGNVAMIKLLADTLYVPGKVGIGTTNPGAYKLYVNGPLYVAFGGCTGCSDLRWKKDISTISKAVETVSRLRGVNFEWRVDEYPDMFFNKGRDLGLIAQEVEKVLPELVYEDKGYKFLRYDKFVPLLVEAIKEQQKEIEDMKEEIQRLKVRKEQ